MRQTVTQVLLITALLCQSSVLADVSVTHRLINSKPVAGGTEMTFHLQLTNRSLHHYYDLTITPVDPAFLLAPNEIIVSLDSLGSDKSANIPWKVVLPYSAAEFQNELPIAFQGSATDENGMPVTVRIFSQQGVR
jgi:hypothetical protein